MDATREQVTEADVYAAIYKRAKLGSDAVIGLLSRTKNNGLRSQMARQLDGYERHASAARRALTEMGREAREEHRLYRAAAGLGLTLQTLTGAGAGRIAELLIEEANGNATEMTRWQNTAAKDGAAARLCGEMIAFEEENVAALRRFL